MCMASLIHLWCKTMAQQIKLLKNGQIDFAQYKYLITIIWVWTIRASLICVASIERFQENLAYLSISWLPSSRLAGHIESQTKMTVCILQLFWIMIALSTIDINFWFPVVLKFQLSLKQSHESSFENAAGVLRLLCFARNVFVVRGGGARALHSHNVVVADDHIISGNNIIGSACDIHRVGNRRAENSRARCPRVTKEDSPRNSLNKNTPL